MSPEISSRSSDVALAERALVALYSGDADALAKVVDSAIVLRDLNPHGLEEVHGREKLLAVADHVCASEGEVLRSGARPAGERVQVTYAVSMAIDGRRGRFEKHGFCDVRDGRVTAIDQVCSGRQVDLGA